MKILAVPLLLLAGLAFAPLRAGVGMEATPDLDDAIQLSATMDNGRPVWVRICLRGENMEDLYEKHLQERDHVGSDWWGGPRHLVSTFEVRVGNDFIPMFRSAYDDLADIRTVDLTTEKNTFLLTIRGGESGEAYTAKLHFRDGFLLAREVHHNDMGLQEKTQYLYPH